LLLPSEEVIVIVPPHLLTDQPVRKKQRPVPQIEHWVRIVLVLMSVGLIGVFSLAVWLNPYDGHGKPRLMGTHMEMGLPPCTFYEVTGMPCPSCGMTTSFSLLMHGDMVNSLRANAVGTLFAVFCLVLIPWNLVCAFRSRLYWIRSLETSATLVLLILLVLMLLRWGIVLLTL
jgi:hypothetical protein